MPHWIILTMLIGGAAGVVVALVLEIVLMVLVRPYRNDPDPFDPIRPYLDAKYDETNLLTGGYRLGIGGFKPLIPRIFFNKYDRYMHLPYVDILVWTARLGYLCIIPAALAYLGLKIGF